MRARIAAQGNQSLRTIAQFYQERGVLEAGERGEERG